MSFPRELYDALAEELGKDVVDGKIRNFLYRVKKSLKAKKSKVTENTEMIESVVNYLNEKTGKHFRASNSETRRLIQGLINDKYTLDDFKHVIDIKCKDWLNCDDNQTDWSKFLRPATLFSKKFENYLNEWYSDQSRTENSQRIAEKRKSEIATKTWRYESNMERLERVQREKTEGKVPNPSTLKIDKKTGKPLSNQEEE